MGILKASQKLIGLSESFYDLLTGLEKVSVITSMEVDKSGDATIPLSERGAKLSIQDLNFYYRPGGAAVLKSLSLDIKGGERITILGEPASGKSTLINLVATFLKPCAGSIEIDEVDLRETRPDSLAETMAVLTSEAKFFAGTVFENVRCGRQLDLHENARTVDHVRWQGSSEAPFRGGKYHSAQ